mmetsp:Transcript_81743/g.162245  ORF Transcript_81743/g.162245 Transcript_81743/m.162245 type:complete len:221 (-) Transcript_81743:104-766(-)
MAFVGGARWLLTIFSAAQATCSIATCAAAADSVEKINGTFSKGCVCGEGQRCANQSTAPGIGKRNDSPDCCCPANASLIWLQEPAKCQEVHRCTYVCCSSTQKLCGNKSGGFSCCKRQSKCISGACADDPQPRPMPTPAPSPRPSPPQWFREWWRILPGPVWHSILFDIAMPALLCGCGTAVPRVVHRARAALPWIPRRQPMLLPPREFDVLASSGSSTT